MTSSRPDGPTPSRAEPMVDSAEVGLRQLQDTIRSTFGARDRGRGVDATLGWFIEEAGELSRAIRRQGGADESRSSRTFSRGC